MEKPQRPEMQVETPTVPDQRPFPVGGYSSPPVCLLTSSASPWLPIYYYSRLYPKKSFAFYSPGRSGEVAFPSCLKPLSLPGLEVYILLYLRNTRPPLRTFHLPKSFHASGPLHLLCTYCAPITTTSLRALSLSKTTLPPFCPSSTRL
ncbi:Hypothetical predicted protein [Marmota monax]|uniref:Uncharacterized protein n=1 Tax=Marmota monax TaxID=9995 RepID=A0A5E4CED6_MARMO|nr:hypothetical protein GHT09_007781 [Marmota monax]VTJ80198.1 Hypothetical predicted protein [Marmota monax]